MNIRPQRRTRNLWVDMTPLIDVVFLLLIFFMVSTTFDKQQQLKVDLPEASAKAEEQHQQKTIEVVVDGKGRFYVGGRELVTHDVETLKRAFKKISEGKPETPIRVTADRRAPFQSVVEVMDAAAQLGMQRLSFLTQAAAGPE